VLSIRLNATSTLKPYTSHTSVSIHVKISNMNSKSLKLFQGKVKFKINFSASNEFHFSIDRNFEMAYDSSFFYSYVKHQAFGFSDYVAEIGGLIGLIAGVSVTSTSSYSKYPSANFLEGLRRKFIRLTSVEMSEKSTKTTFFISS
jgi:hypothetical protein